MVSRKGKQRKLVERNGKYGKQAWMANKELIKIDNSQLIEQVKNKNQ